jgi:hypothetical protein
MDQRGNTPKYSATNIGRFALLGKESRWTYTSPELLPSMEIATLLQNLVVPQDKDTLCPFLPVEIGGNGSFCNDPMFMKKFINSRPLEVAREARFRVYNLLSNRLGVKYLRVLRGTSASAKLHRYADISGRLLLKGHLIPEDAIVALELCQRDSSIVEFLSTMKRAGFITPFEAFNELLQSAYYRHILEGRGVPEPLSFSFPLKSGYSLVSDSQINWEFFVHRYRTGDFMFKEHEPYLVDRDRLEVHRYLNLGWTFQHNWRLESSKEFKEFQAFVRTNVPLLEQGFEALKESLMRNEISLPGKFLPRSRLYFETDRYILYQIQQWTVGDLPEDGRLFLVSLDEKLGHQIKSLVNIKFHVDLRIILIHPLSHLAGRSMFHDWDVYRRRGRRRRGWVKIHQESMLIDTSTVIIDHGATIHWDLVGFVDGAPVYDVWEGTPILREKRSRTGDSVILVEAYSNLKTVEIPRPVGLELDYEPPPEVLLDEEKEESD